MFRFTTAGESHGRALVAIVEGLPAGMPVDVDQINHELKRRQWGYGRGGRMKIEQDQVEILSGVRHGLTLGSPIALMIENKDWANWTEIMASGPSEIAPEKSRSLRRPRPGHADLAGGQKFGARDLRNILERASARETTSRVACGALAKQLLDSFGAEVRSHVIQLGGIPEKPLELSWDEVVGIADDEPLRCADAQLQQQMIELIDRKREAGDTVGGIFEVVARGVIPGLGSHTAWDLKLDGRLAQAVMSIPAVKAVSIGAGSEASAACRVPKFTTKSPTTAKRKNSFARLIVRAASKEESPMAKRSEFAGTSSRSPRSVGRCAQLILIRSRRSRLRSSVQTLPLFRQQV